jgi:hypothetical protein
MNRIKLSLFMAILAQALPGLGQTIDTSVYGVLAITPGESYISAPVFIPFCSDVVWLEKRAFQLSIQQFLPEDSSINCIPEKARRVYAGTNPKYMRFMRWEADPFDAQYFWTFEYKQDTLCFWRYDLESARLDSFISLVRERTTVDHAIGKAGIWAINHQELVLHDRHTGLIHTRAPKPKEGQIMQLRPWGDDVLVNDRWLFRRSENRYEDFFPLPADMKGCQTHSGMAFFGESCISSTMGGSYEGAEFLISSGSTPIRLPFNKHWSIRRYDLAVNPPLAWFSFPGKVLAFDFSTGDSMVYSGNTGTPLIGNHAGRFLAFESEKGLSFFDKNSRQFGVINRPFGFEVPRNYTSDQRFIYLTYENHWEIIDFSKLESTFQHSIILEEFQAFDQARKTKLEGLPEDFYAQYEAYAGLAQKYQSLNNPKIEAEWPRVSNHLAYLLWQAPDSVLERVATNYHSGRFSPTLSCGIVQALFMYWCRKTELKQALQLLTTPGNEACISEYEGYGDYFMALVRATQHQLDSVEASAALPDERLYATGTIWWGFCSSQMGFGYLWPIEEGLKKPMSCFRELILKYPTSPWADNAVYDTLYFIDYQPQATDDYTPPGNDNTAYKVFTQFLKDYPESDRRPDVLVRLANVIQRGVYDAQHHNIDKEAAADHLYTVETEYPDFAYNSKEYKASLARQNRYQWSNRWIVSLAFDKDIYQKEDSILVTVKLQNRSGSAKTLEPAFLKDWHKGLKLQLSKVVEKGCEGLWGDFPLLPIRAKDTVEPVTVQPRAYYAETFVLKQKSYTKRFYPGSFELESGATYDYYLEFRHEDFSWLWVEAKNRGRILVK